jgi:small-conductance mechanosensitive channel
VLRPRIPSELLATVLVWLLAVPVVLIGIYAALRVAGLTQLALTVLGGTGLAGLIIGIAFRDIAENFLASVLLSVRNPFRAGDRIELDGYVGIVQRITTRGTILMTLEGNHLQIPNSTVYKSTITNYTANPVRRMDFAVGIGYDASIAEAQNAIDTVLREHPVVLDDPEPLVLVEDLGSATVDLRAYFWFNGTQYEGLKLKSALIRLAKRSLELRGISMPDEAREVIFPQGVPIVESRTPAEVQQPETTTTVAPRVGRPVEPDALSTDAEGGLRSEDASIQEQARQARIPEAGENLLGPPD